MKTAKSTNNTRKNAGMGNILVSALGKNREVVLLLVLGAVLVNLSLFVQRFQLNVLSSGVLLIVALLQLSLFGITLFVPNKKVFLFGFWINVAILVANIVSFLTITPLSTLPDMPQVLGLAEIVSTLLAFLAAIFYLWIFVSWKKETDSRIRSIVIVSIISLIFIGLLTWIGVKSALNDIPRETNMSAPVVPGMQSKSITALQEKPGDQPVKEVTLVAEQKIINGRTIWSYNGTIPGPEIRVTQGDRLRVRFTNHLPVSTSIHWHGVNLPNAEDGVAGLTQDALKPGETYTYEFVLKDAGSYMYHSHQDTSNQMLRGLFGALIVEPKGKPTTDQDIGIVLHEIPGDNAIAPNGMLGYFALRRKEQAVFNGNSGDLHFDAKPGQTVRLRIMAAIQGEAGQGTDYMIAPPRYLALLGTPYQVVEIDGNDVNAPQTIGPKRIPLGIGQRYDLVFTVPESGAVRLVDIQGQETVTIGNGPVPETKNLGSLPQFDIMNYGKPTVDSIIASKGGKFDVTYPFILNFQSGLREDKLELVQTINGQFSPMMAQYVVKKGQLVHFHIVNKTEEYHVIHLHGHSFTVLDFNGKKIQGSPIHMDSLLVPPYTNWDIAFLADNPGLWMVHCHVLVHAAFGMSAMVEYEGYTTPYNIGALSGNKPE